VGREHEAQEVVEEELKRLGFEVDRLPIPDGIESDPLAGVPQLSYDGRFDVVGRSGAAQGPSLLLNAHIDVVPAEQPDRWASPPFEPRRDGDRLYGRGAGDMKSGFAMAALALDALRATCPGRDRRPPHLRFSDRGGVHRQRHARRGEGGSAR
jgi:acetylornithine deacetylase